jgi:NhaP-type Na+/H+ or K+/H+ antiporter
VVAAAANHDAKLDRTLGEEGESGANAAVVRTVIFVAMSLTLASLVEALPGAVLRLFPQSVLVLLLFLVCGLIVLAIEGNAGSFASFVHGIELSPEGLQLIFLPPLIFSELFKSNVHVFMRVLSQTLLLAFPGVLICTGLIALFPLYMLPSQWSAYEALAFGGMLSATVSTLLLSAKGREAPASAGVAAGAAAAAATVAGALSSMVQVLSSDLTVCIRRTL